MLYSFSLADLSWLVYIDQKWDFDVGTRLSFVESMELRPGFGYGFYIYLGANYCFC